MKVLFLTNIPSPYRVEFFSLLGKQCDLTVIYELKYATNRDKKWKVDVKKTYKEIFLNAKRILADGGFSFNVLKYLNKKYDFIIVGTHGTPIAKLAMIYMRIRKIPYILNLDGALTYTLENRNKINLFLRKIMFQGAKYYLTTNDESIKYLNFFGIKKEKIYKYRFSSIKQNDIKNDIQEKEKKDLLKQKLGIKEKYVIISVGRLSVDGDIFAKGFDKVLLASKYFKDDIGIYIVGADIIDSYKKIIKENKLEKIYFEGFKNKYELDEYYSVADIFVFMSKCDTWGLVINEALAKGLPIITTDRCGAGLELIKDYKNGFLLHTGDYVTLGKRINEILDNKNLKKSMRDNNYKLATEYTIEKMVIDHINILKKIKG